MRFDNQKHLRSYLLGALSPERAEQLEARLLTDDELLEQLSLIEDELIEDYARNALSANERKQFKKFFLMNPRRRRKLMLVQGLRKYTRTVGHVSAADKSPRRAWYFPILTPQWRAVAAVLLILIAGTLTWRFYFHRSDIDKGLQALNEAYKTKRSIEARTTGLNYAPFSGTRGPAEINSRDLDRSAALLQNAVDEKRSADALHALGRFYLLNRDFDKAISNFEEALKKTPDDAKLHSDLGAALLEKGKLDRTGDRSGHSETTLASSLEHLKRALELDDSLLDARFNRALLYEEMRLTPQALEDWEKYLTLDPGSPWSDEARRKIEALKKRGEKVSQRTDDLMLQFLNAHAANDHDTMWQIFSDAHLRTGNAVTDKLIDHYVAAATMPGQSDEAAKWLNILVEVGKLSSDKTGDRFTADTAEVYRSATPGQLQSLAQARHESGKAYELYGQSKNDEAIPIYNHARSTFTAIGNHPEALLASFWLSYCFTQRGDPQTVIALLEQVARECETRNYKWLLSLTQIGLANSRPRKTEYSRALEYSWASYYLSQQISDRNGELRSLNMLAGLYRDIGDYRRSLYSAQQGLRLGTEISADASQMVGFYGTSAWSLSALGHYAAALEYEKQALNLAEVMDSPLVRSRYRVQMGLIEGMSKNYDEAIRNIRLGIEVGTSVEKETIGREMSTYGELYLGQAYRQAGRYPEALTTLATVENFCRENTDDRLWLLHEVKKQQLLTRIAQGDLVAASEDLTQVLSNYEDQRQKIREESNRESFFAKEQNIYDIAIDFAYSHSDSQKAFDYSETSRARSFLDTSSDDWRLTDEQRTPDLHFSNALKPMPLDEIRQKLPSRTQLLQYAVLKDKLIIWYLTRDRFESAVVNVSSDDLMEKVDRLLTLVTKPSSDNQLNQETAGELFDLLIKPVGHLLDPQKQLCITPDKALNLLPFDILFSASSQRYLIEDFTLSYASSANVFVHQSEVAAEKAAAGDETLFGVGNPYFDRKAFPDLADLPSAAREVEDIRKFYNHSSSLINDNAKKTAVLNEMRNADVLHFATHYLPDATSPMLSKLVLARDSNGQEPDEVLRAFEIYRLKPLRSRLAILAGCQTGIEGYVDGEGPIGLARPFHSAGVPLVIASLWPVDSTATTDLMIEFHRLRTQNHYSSAEALRGAQVQMLRQPNGSHRNAYYWASFSPIGGYSNY